MTPSESDFLAGTAYTVQHEEIQVRANNVEGLVYLDIGPDRHLLNLGHLEQLDNAVRRALIWLAVNPAEGRNAAKR